MAEIRFMTGEPALLAGSTLIIADLHLGIEREFFQSGIKLPSQTERMTGRIESLIEAAGAERLVILGDVKHKVPGISIQEIREVPEFLSRLSGRLKVDIVMGNHDAGIEAFAPKGVSVHPVTGFRLDDMFLSHGHAWPGKESMSCGHIIIGHQHPMIEFRDRLGYRFREPVWARGELSRDKLAGKYGKLHGKLPELIVMPAFSALSGGAAINRRPDKETERNFIGPVMRAACEKGMRVFLLDGTYLGTLSDMKKHDA